LDRFVNVLYRSSRKVIMSGFLKDEKRLFLAYKGFRGGPILTGFFLRDVDRVTLEIVLGALLIISGGILLTLWK
jgi:hypothetical protein